jgi:hypothetical protein
MDRRQNDPSSGRGQPGVLGSDIAGIQILAEVPADSVMHPEVPTDPGTRKDYWILRRPEVPVDGRALSRAAAQVAKIAVPQSRWVTGRSWRTRTVPPLCAAGGRGI